LLLARVAQTQCSVNVRGTTRLTSAAIGESSLTPATWSMCANARFQQLPLSRVPGLACRLGMIHEAASRIADSTTVNAAYMPDVRGLVQRYLQWSQLHNKKLELRQASQEAEKAAALFTTKRDTLESNIKTRKQEGAAGSGPAPPAGASFTTSARDTSPELVRAMKRRSALVKDLTNLNERVEDQNRLESNEGIKHCAAPNL